MTNNTLTVVNNQSVFNFNSSEIRAFADSNGEFWFLANDICSILGYKNPRDAIAKNCKRGGVAKRDTPTQSGNQEMTYINEPNLYRLIIKSRMPEAEAFEEWVMEEVLPQIRKTGQYQVAPYSVNPGDKLSKEQQDILRGLVKSHAAVLPHNKQAGAIIKTWSKLKSHFKVPYRDIPQEEFSEAVSIIQRTAAEWELADDLPAAPEEDNSREKLAEHYERCMGLALETSGKASLAIFKHLIKRDGLDDFYNRLVVTQGHDGETCVTTLDNRASISTPEQLMKRISIPGDYYATPNELAGIAKACLERLENRFSASESREAK